MLLDRENNKTATHKLYWILKESFVPSPLSPMEQIEVEKPSPTTSRLSIRKNIRDETRVERRRVKGTYFILIFTVKYYRL